MPSEPGSEPAAEPFDDEERRICQLLRRKMREKGMTYEQVEQRAGMSRDYLRQVIGGRVKLRVEHVRKVLAALGIPPADFWMEVYGPAPTPLSSEQRHPTFATSVRVMHRSLLRRMIWKLKEKGVFNSEEATRMLEELEQTVRLVESSSL